MIKVGIIGASGMAGSAIYKLASKQENLDVTGIVRNKEKAEKVLGADANLLIGDIFDMHNDLLKDFDVIVDAFGTAPAEADQQVTLAKKLIPIAKDSDERVIFILGAGSLRTGDDKHLFVEDIEKAPDSAMWINTPKQQLKELEYLRTVDNVDWVGISPSMTFEAGPEAKKFTIGGDDLLFNAAGESKVTAGTMALVVVDEILKPEHHQERITVVEE